MSEKSSFDVNCAPPFLKNSLLAPYMPYGTSLASETIIEHLSSSVLLIPFGYAFAFPAHSHSYLPFCSIGIEIEAGHLCICTGTDLDIVHLVMLLRQRAGVDVSAHSHLITGGESNSSR